MRPDPIAIVLLMATVSPAVAQGPTVLLRYHPRPGSQVIMRGDMTLAQTISISGEPDSQRTVTTMVFGTSRQVVRNESGQFRVRVTVDSMSGGVEMNGQRRDMPTQILREWVEMLVDSLGRPMVPPGTVGDTSKRLKAWQLQGYEELAFPATPVHAGSRWSNDVTKTIEDMGLSTLPVPGAKVGPVRAQLDAVVDSVVPRGGDTLVYVAINSRVGPLNMSFTEGTDHIALSMTGRKTTVQIWSTGWQSWVSTGSHARFDMNMTGTENGKAQKALAVFDLTQSGRVKY